MITAKEFPNKEFATQSELFEELRTNKKTLIAQKKMITKQGDAISQAVNQSPGDKNSNKALTMADDSVNKISAQLVINTTGIMDSHGDVHIAGIWNKTIKENKSLLLLQEHEMTFDKIISDKVVARSQVFTWKDLGFDYDGETEALVFDAEIEKNRNTFMFNQYVKGYVKEHSVGMRYIKMDLAINSETEADKEEKIIWDKYINTIANKADAEAQGYFWAVHEAKAIEGSAVVKGSNPATPTINVEAAKSTLQIPEPSDDTQKKLFYQSLFKN